MSRHPAHSGYLGLVRQPLLRDRDPQVKPLLAAFAAVLLLDVAWWLVNGLGPPRRGDLLLFLDPLVGLLFIAVGVFVAIVGRVWGRPRFVRPGFYIAIVGALQLVLPAMFMIFMIATGHCQCEGG